MSLGGSLWIMPHVKNLNHFFRFRGSESAIVRRAAVEARNLAYFSLAGASTGRTIVL